MLDTLAVQALAGLSGAATLFLIAAGLTLVFGVSRIANFAHGSLAMLGAYLGWSILTRLPPTPGFFVLGVLAAAALVGGIGLGLERLLLRRLYGAPELMQLLATFGLVLIIQDLVLHLWGPDTLELPRPPWLRAALPAFGTRLPVWGLVLPLIGLAVFAFLWLLISRTRLGSEIRAVTENRTLAAALGVDERFLSSLIFALGAALAGLAGALSLPDGSANLQLDLGWVVDAFIVVVVGGLGSLPGAALASLLIGLGRAFGILFAPSLTLLFAVGLMALVLALRPRGLAGRVAAEPALETTRPMLRPAGPMLRAFALLALLAAALAPFFAGPFLLSVLSEAAIAILFAASLQLMMGPGGMPSFGHAAWYALGAYGTAFAFTGWGLPWPLAVVVGPALALAAALLVGAVAVRRSGVYLAMFTLAIAQIIWALAVQAVALTGGDNGILGLYPPGLSGARLYWLVLVLCVAAALLLRRVGFSRFGFALRAVRDAPARAAALGLPGERLRLATFTLCGAAAGLAGSAEALAKGAVFPTNAEIGHSVDALVMVLLGGMDSLTGPWLGGVLYTFLYDYLLQSATLWRLALGAMILALVLYLPRGLAGGRR